MSTGRGKERPLPRSGSKSFTRFEPLARSSDQRHRASTIPTPRDMTQINTGQDKKRHVSDIFEHRPSMDDGEVTSPEKLEGTAFQAQNLPDRFGEIPLELLSFTDRFIDSLSAKTWSEPPTIELLSNLFQEFYSKANAQIAVHISALSSKLTRESSPAASVRSSRSGTLSKHNGLKRDKDSFESLDKVGRDQQMLTASEVAEKRKARKLLELKRVALEEAVEKRACERPYASIWRHKSTLDEVRDEKLRSKTAALALVDIGLDELGIDIGDKAKNAEEIRSWLAPAMEGLANMNNEKSPLGKLQHLTNAHKHIVEMLSKIHPSSSSADEILPTLIYTLISSPPEGINVISNLLFIQRFRNQAKIDGEAAYCMTNLEAAIGFLEDVDLASLRADETPEGPSKSPARPVTPQSAKPDPYPTPKSASGKDIVEDASTEALVPTVRPTLGVDVRTSSDSSPLPSPSHHRRLSNMLQPIGAANEAVRSTADQGFKNISNTLDSSFKFMFGKLREQSEDGATADSVMPKTLDEARRLVSQSLTPDDPISETSSVTEMTTDPASKSEDKLLGLIGGRRAPLARDRSVDSAQSVGSGKRVGFATGSSSNLVPTPTSNSSNPPPNALDSMKNFGNSINPLNHLANFGGGLRAFGGSKPTPSPSLAPAPIPVHVAEKPGPHNAVEVINPATLDKIKVDPPLQRFVEMKSAGDMRVDEISELLKDYQRIAVVLKELAS
ncbi:MAG: hypothetical protein Q9160_004201 [Pyrenula sp. 1 TL-2023]